MESPRRSTSRRPNSPGATASTHRIVSDPRHGEADHGTSHPEGRKRSTSVSDLLNKILPSRRPERRGTLRDQGFWEEQQAGGINPSHIPSPSQRPKLRARHGSDSIASSAWNQPTDLPRRTQSTYRDQRGKLGSLLSPSRQANDNRPRSSTTSKEPPAHSPVQEHQGVRTDKVMQARTEVMPSTVPQQPADHGTASKSTTVPDSFALFDQKREARRLRRSLKESRDFLGVQGVNPHTGVMDVITPTSSSPSDNTMRSLPELKGYSETMSDFRSAYQRASRSQDAEEASLSLLRKEQERLARLQRHKDTIRAFQHRVRWQKERNQWSSVAEPCLSPILDQSVKSRSSKLHITQSLLLKLIEHKLTRGSICRRTYTSSRDCSEYSRNQTGLFEPSWSANNRTGSHICNTTCNTTSLPGTESTKGRAPGFFRHGHTYASR
jgi:hypothetical protein